jgi:hypothetical protein
MRLYLAGPMTGQTDLNFPTFVRYARLLREKDHDVVSPAEESLRMHGIVYDGSTPLDSEQLRQLASVPWETYLENDLKLIDEVDAVAVLPGWEGSRGATREVQYALDGDLPIYHAAVLVSSDLKNVEDAAVYGDEYAPDFVHPRIDPGELRTSDEFQFYESNPERHTSQTGGVKDNVNKPRLDLVPSLPLFRAGEVLAFGARKYKPHNWRLGLSWLETYGSLQRHLAAWLDGEDLDQESGMHHLAHATCQMLFLAEFVFRGTGEDDRFVSLDAGEAMTDEPA